MYGYLVFTGLLAALWLVIWIIRPDLRRKKVISSVASAPLGLANPMFIPEYWNPIVVYRIFGIFDIESILFSFFIGGVAGTIYFVASGRPLKKETPTLPPHHAGFALGVVFFTIGSLAYVKHNGPIPAIVTLHVGALIGIAYAWRVRPDLIRVSMASGVLFPLVYLIILVMTETIVPSFVSTLWSGYATFGLHPFGIPLDEYVYASLFAAGWSIVYETGLSIIRGLQQPVVSRSG